MPNVNDMFMGPGSLALHNIKKAQNKAVNTGAESEIFGVTAKQVYI